jgi:hypothetical protein
MKTYHFRKVVDIDGSVTLSDLPPHQEVEIVVVSPEPSDLPEGIESWLEDIRARHAFARMSKKNILKLLRETRDVVWAERHADQFGH